jgi:UDP-galactose transporter B1
MGYLILYLALGAFYSQFHSGDISSSELFRSSRMIMRSSELRTDIIIFCICASLGQYMIFEVMKDFGSLMWITISVTRKLFTILLSIYQFNHPVNTYQLVGIFAVFVGMGLEIVVKYNEEKSTKKDKID